jgi:hypothetical protein
LAGAIHDRQLVGKVLSFPLDDRSIIFLLGGNGSGFDGLPEGDMALIPGPEDTVQKA